MKTIATILLATLAFAATSDPKAEKEVLATMETYRQAMIHNDANVLGKLLADDLTFVHSAGLLESKADVLKSVTTGKNVIKRMEFSDMSVRLYGKTALVKCRVDLWHSDTDIVHMNILHAWVNGPAGWQLVARQATRLTP